MPAPVGHNKKISRFPFELFAGDFAHAAALDNVVKLARRMAVLTSFFARVEHLDPAGKSRKGRTTGHRIAILKTFAVAGALALRQHLGQRTASLLPFINERFER